MSISLQNCRNRGPIVSILVFGNFEEESSTLEVSAGMAVHKFKKHKSAFVFFARIFGITKNILVLRLPTVTRRRALARD